MWSVFKHSGGASSGKGFDIKGLLNNAKTAYTSFKGYAKPIAQGVAGVIGPPQQEGQKAPGFKSSLNIIGKQIGNLRAPPQLPPVTMQWSMPPQYYAAPVVAAAAIRPPPPPHPISPPPPPPPQNTAPQNTAPQNTAPQNIAPQNTAPPPQLPPPKEWYDMCKQEKERTETELQVCLDIIARYEASLPKN